jgi:hypothetical protein
VRMIRHSLIVILAAALLALLSAAPVHAPGESYRFSFDWVWQVEDSLIRGAVNGPKWHANQIQIHRHIQDVSYFLQRAVEAARVSDHAAQEAHARQAISLLQRGVRKGFFRQSELDTVVAIIKQHLPGIEV